MSNLDIILDGLDTDSEFMKIYEDGLKIVEKNDIKKFGIQELMESSHYMQNNADIVEAIFPKFIKFISSKFKFNIMESGYDDVKKELLDLFNCWADADDELSNQSRVWGP